MLDINGSNLIDHMCAPRSAAGGACTILVKSGTTLLDTLVFTGATNGPYLLLFEARPYWITAVNEALNFDLSAAVAVIANVGYVRSA